MPPQSVVGTFNMTRNRNVQDFASYHVPLTLISDFEILGILVISNKISRKAYENWQHLVIPYKVEYVWLQLFVLLCRYVDSNINIRFEPNAFADNQELTVM